MKTLAAALIALGSLGFAHHTGASMTPKQYEIYCSDGYIGSGDEAEFGNSTSNTVEYEVYDNDTMSFLWSFEVDPAKVVNKKLDRSIYTKRLDVGGERDDVDSLCGIDCFPKGTLLQTPSGLRDISDIEVGDEVLLGQDSKPAVVAMVQSSAALAVVRLHIDGAILEPSVGHPLRTAQRGWVKAGELTDGDSLLASTGAELPIRSIDLVESAKAQPVYNLVLEEGDSFLVGKLGIQAASAPAPQP